MKKIIMIFTLSIILLVYGQMTYAADIMSLYKLYNGTVTWNAPVPQQLTNSSGSTEFSLTITAGGTVSSTAGLELNTTYSFSPYSTVNLVAPATSSEPFATMYTYSGPITNWSTPPTIFYVPQGQGSGDMRAYRCRKFDYVRRSGNTLYYNSYRCHSDSGGYTIGKGSFIGCVSGVYKVRVDTDFNITYHELTQSVTIKRGGYASGSYAMGSEAGGGAIQEEIDGGTTYHWPFYYEKCGNFYGENKPTITVVDGYAFSVKAYDPLGLLVGTTSTSYGTITGTSSSPYTTLSGTLSGVPGSYTELTVGSGKILIKSVAKPTSTVTVSFY